MSQSDYFIARLSEADRDSLAIFDCYNESEYGSLHPRVKKRIRKHSMEMNRFLKNEAAPEQIEGYNTTFLVKGNDGVIRAYMSLCTDAIRLSYSERGNGKIGYETFPSLKIARLAVDKSYQKSNYGKLLIKFSISKALLLRKEACGVKFITLDCYSHRLSYYTGEKIGFVQNEKQPNGTDGHASISLRLHIDDYLDKLS